MVLEGATRIVVPGDAAQPEPASGRGPKSRHEDGPFYNPAMARNRDLSVLLVEAYAQHRGRQIDVADVLAGAGARSLRLANEVNADLTVHANDGDPRAIEAIREGMALNGVAPERLQVNHAHAHGFLAGRRFDVIDLDPFGSPTPFLDAATAALRHDGLLCLTATDTGALSGTYPRVCKRRYGARPLHQAPWRAEVGLRILAATAIQAAGRHDRAATPVLSVCNGHWMRVVVQVQDGKKAADGLRQRCGWVTADPKTGLARQHEDPRTIGPGEAYGGPMWLGPLHDGDLVERMAACATDKQLADPHTDRLLDMLVQEAHLPAFWFDRGRLQSRFGDAPRRDDLIGALRDAGFKAGRTHMDPQGIRTDAHLESLQNVWTTVRHRE